MTVTTDDRRRVILPSAVKPGERFDLQPFGEGFMLRKLEPVSAKTAKVRFEKRGRYTVAVADQPMNEEALREALADFP